MEMNMMGNFRIISFMIRMRNIVLRTSRVMLIIIRVSLRMEKWEKERLLMLLELSLKEIFVKRESLSRSNTRLFSLQILIIEAS